MPKIRRSRQPRDWQNKTFVRSHGGLLKGKQNFSLSPVSNELQLKKMRRNLERFKKQIHKLIQEKSFSITSNERKAEIEALILKREEKFYHAQTRYMIVENQLKTSIKREKSKKENLAKEFEQAKKNAENFEKFAAVLSPEQKAEVNRVFPSLPKRKIEVQGKKRRVKVVKEKTWDAQPERKQKTVRSGVQVVETKDGVKASVAKKVELK